MAERRLQQVRRLQERLERCVRENSGLDETPTRRFRR
jgi:hypothetical protein